jgi:hypothetical protein
VTRRTDAVVGRGARVTADNAVRVEATATGSIVSVSAAGAGAGKVAVGLTAGVSVVNLPTRAWIDADAVVFARGSVLVQAFDRTVSDLVVGNFAGAGGVAVGVAAGVGVVTKSTLAWIEGGAQVTALGLSGTVTAYTGAFAPGTGTDVRQDAVSREFSTSALNAGTDRITIAGHGFQTGDAVMYAADRAPLGGLISGGRYFVIRDGADTLRLAGSAADAASGTAIDIAAGNAVATDLHTLERLGDLGVPTVDNEVWDAAGLDSVRQGAALMEARRGLVVAAVSVNDLESAGAAGGGAGSVAVQPRPRLISHRLIEECMITANVAAANVLSKSKFAGLYRIHDAPNAEKLENLRASLAPLGLRVPQPSGGPKAWAPLVEKISKHPAAAQLLRSILQSQMQAKYDTGNIGDRKSVV